MTEKPFFVNEVSSSVLKAFQYADKDPDRKLESDERLICTDLVCEGPIEGLVDKQGNLLKYISDTNNTQIENIILGRGVYYNDVPLIDDKLDKFNFVTLGFDIRYGEEFNNYSYEVPATVHRYSQKIYLNDSESFEKDLSSNAVPYPNGIYCFKNIFVNGKAQAQEIKSESTNNAFASEISKKYSSNLSSLVALMDSAKANCQEFNHKILNKYCDQISVQLRADQLFKTQDGNVIVNTIYVGIEISEDNSANRFFTIVALSGVSKAGYVIDIPINLSLDSLNKNSYYVKIFSLSAKISPTNGTIFKDLSVAAIVEKVMTRGNFAYPFSAIVRSAVSSRHFNQDPSRTFDLKMLKIKVPKNYDPEAHEYSGDWDGNFDSFLRWTDNPAWIFYDICTNTRYGVGNGKIYDKDLNKWELYKISKYCDELVRVTSPHAYAEDVFQISNENKNNILIKKTSSDSNVRSLDEFRKQYPPIVGNSSYASANGGFNNSIIYLYNLKNDDGSIDKNYKKIIWAVDEIGMDENGKEIVVPEGQGSFFRIQLMNDFGPRRAFENGGAATLLSDFTKDKVFPINNNLNIKERIAKNKDNTESGAKSYILSWYANHINDSNGFAATIVNKACFSDDIFSGTVTGTCLPRTQYYRDPLEPRFSCNVYIDNETECLKILNDLASVFRGLTYYKNNFITATIDVEKPVSYLFNNTNVKNGAFIYSSGSLDGNYTVAKVLFRDKYENYDQQVEIVEDSYLMKQYGIVTKEILGFGITSRDQARRIGQWLLTTNRFENQTITFATDLQGIILKPSDVIQIEDQNKNDSILQGRVAEVNMADKYIVIDRKLNLNSTGQVIKFIADLQNKTIESLNSQSSVSNSDIAKLNRDDVIELKIDRIENNTNRVYIDQSYNFKDFNKIISSTPFIVENSRSNSSKNLYKIISISETDNNEYAIFCIKHDPSKYQALTNNSFTDTTTFVDNAIAYADSDVLKEIDLSGLYTLVDGVKTANYYSINPYTINQINSQPIDYSFNEIQSSLIYKSQADYYVLTINFDQIFSYILNKSTSGSASEISYFSYINEVLQKKGGLLCKVTLRNQSLKFKIQNDNISNKRIFLGKFGSNSSIVSANSGLRIYLYDRENKIIEV